MILFLYIYTLKLQISRGGLIQNIKLTMKVLEGGSATMPNSKTFFNLIHNNE